MSERSPTLGSLLNDYVESRLTDLHVSLPGIVKSYDATNNLAAVRLAVKKRYRDENDNLIVEEYPILKNVPVAFMQCAKAWFTFPLAADDRVQVHFSEVSIGTWVEGAQKTPVDPEDATPHPLAGAYCVPGLYPKAEKIQPAVSTSHVALATSGSGVHVLLGENDDAGMQFVALAQKVLDELNKIQTAFSGHTHTVSTSSACTAGGATATGNAAAGPTYTPAAVAAERVKAK